jgi:hypothetical protein
VIAKILSHLQRIVPQQHGSELPHLSEKGCRRQASAYHRAVQAQGLGLEGWFERPIRRCRCRAGCRRPSVPRHDRPPPPLLRAALRCWPAHGRAGVRTAFAHQLMVDQVALAPAVVRAIDRHAEGVIAE